MRKVILILFILITLTTVFASLATTTSPFTPEQNSQIGKVTPLGNCPGFNGACGQLTNPPAWDW